MRRSPSRPFFRPPLPFLLFALLTALWLVCAPPVAATESPPVEGSGASYWGPIPAPADSVTARYESNRPSAWEYPLLGAYWLAKAPFEIVDFAVGNTVVALDESGALYRVRELYSPLGLPWGFRLSGIAGELTGVGGGLGFHHDAFLGEGNALQLKATLTSKRNSKAGGGMVFRVGPRRSFLELGGGYRKNTNARFFGLGPYTPESAESFFTQEATWAGLTYQYDVGSDVALQGDVLYSALRSRGPRSPQDDVPLDEVFSGSLPTGYGEESDGWTLRFALQHDDSEGPGRPRSGGLRRARVAWFQPDDSAQADFLSYRLEAQQFVGLWWDRALALRGWWSWIDSDDEPVHFQRLMTNDDPDLLRGYEDWRWRGRGMTAASAEYRWPVWTLKQVDRTGLDAYTFVDYGQVFENRQQISLDAMTTSGGFGFRLATSRGFGGRLEVGFSDEDTVIRLQAHQVFQYDRQGLYHGRNPIPSR